jgi:thiol-disulfide isomerase/thioredoxin
VVDAKVPCSATHKSDRHVQGDMNRRRLLATVGTLGTGAVAGCLGGAFRTGGGGSDGGGGGETTPTSPIELESLGTDVSSGGSVQVTPGGTTVVLDFFATWCGPCKPQLDELATVQDAVGDEVAFRSITSETDRESIRSFWRQHGGAWPVLLDPDLTAARKYGVEGLPTTVVVDGDGRVQWRHTGLAGAGTVRSAVEGTID